MMRLARVFNAYHFRILSEESLLAYLSNPVYMSKSFNFTTDNSFQSSPEEVSENNCSKPADVPNRADESYFIWLDIITQYL